jgi:hypothetical protein
VAPGESEPRVSCAALVPSASDGVAVWRAGLARTVYCSAPAACVSGCTSRRRLVLPLADSVANCAFRRLLYDGYRSSAVFDGRAHVRPIEAIRQTPARRTRGAVVRRTNRTPLQSAFRIRYRARSAGVAGRALAKFYARASTRGRGGRGADGRGGHGGGGHAPRPVRVSRGGGQRPARHIRRQLTTGDPALQLSFMRLGLVREPTEAAHRGVAARGW